METSISLILGSAVLMIGLLHSAAAEQSRTPKQKSATDISWGNPGGSGGTLLSEGYNAVDSPFTINCKSASGCTIEIDAMVGLGKGSNESEWAICAFVDGSPVQTPPCWQQGYIYNNFVTGNSRQNATVTLGTHTVQTEVFLNSSAYLENWQSDYILYTPSPQ